ncbi:hypothetical protein C9890_0438 [Perkinsus sp. BL_2016]|nr:hypothetical protein C9890_0438 [Perkinsus sp. BL_2016]
MRFISTISLGVIGTATASDPCFDLCLTVPGACTDEEASFCVDGQCTSLFWMETGVLCNSSNRACMSEPRASVSCQEAETIVVSENVEGVTAFHGSKTAASAPIPDLGLELGNLSFAPRETGVSGLASGIVPGRKGIYNLGATCYLASALQVVMHSRSIREAIVADFAAGEAPMDHLVYGNFVNLMQQMYETASEEPLDLSMLLFALHEFNDHSAFKNESDDSFQALMVLLRGLAEASPRVAEAVELETRGRRECTVCNRESDMPVTRLGVQFISFPGSERQYSVPEMLAAHFSPGKVVDVHCETCKANALQVESPVVTKLPKLLTIAVNRYTYEAEKIRTSLDIPLEISMAGVVAGGEEIRYRLVGIERHMGGHWLLDYLDTDRMEWIHSNDVHIHVISGRPRNGGDDPAIVFYELIQ